MSNPPSVPHPSHPSPAGSAAPGPAGRARRWRSGSSTADTPRAAGEEQIPSRPPRENIPRGPPEPRGLKRSLGWVARRGDEAGARRRRRTGEGGEEGGGGGRGGGAATVRLQRRRASEGCRAVPAAPSPRWPCRDKVTAPKPPGLSSAGPARCGSSCGGGRQAVTAAPGDGDKLRG